MDFFGSYGMPGRWYSELLEVAAGQHGYVTSEDVRGLGGDYQVHVDMERHGHLNRHACGLCRFRAYPTAADAQC